MPPKDETIELNLSQKEKNLLINILMELFHHTISIVYKLIINYEELDNIVEYKKNFQKLLYF